MAQDTGKTSTRKRGKRPPKEIRYADASHPIHSNQIEVRFGNRSRTSTGDSEESSNEPQGSKILNLLAQLFGKE